LCPVQLVCLVGQTKTWKALHNFQKESRKTSFANHIFPNLISLSILGFFGEVR